MTRLTEGNDEHHGDTTEECVLARSGDDVIYTKAGDDVLVLERGTNKGDAGNGDDVVVGGEGADTINGGQGKDVIVGRGGDDRIWGGPGADILAGGLGADELYGGKGDDVLVVETTCDVEAGEKIFGSEGFDVLVTVLTEQELEAAGVTIGQIEQIVVVPVEPEREAGRCNLVFRPFEPSDEFPEEPGVGVPVSEPSSGCVPDERYDPVTQTIVPRTGSGTCPERYCVRNDDGTYTEVTEQQATRPGCAGYTTTVCPLLNFDGSPPPTKDDGTRAGCDDVRPSPVGQCETVEVCPEPLDVPENAAQGEDPPQVNGLSTLPPPDVMPPPEVVTLVDNLTRFLPPCYWATAQAFANVHAGIVPGYGDHPNAPERITGTGVAVGRDVDVPNFVGLPNGSDCDFDVECRSNRCELPDFLATEAVCMANVRLSKDARTNEGEHINDYYYSERKGNDKWNVEVAAGIYEADAHAQGVFYPSVAWDYNAGVEARVSITAGGKSFPDVAAVEGLIRNSHCAWEHSYGLQILDVFEDFDGFELEVGTNVFVAANGLGSDSDHSDSTLSNQCEDAFETLRARERSTNERLWEAIAAAALWNTFGAADAVPNSSAAQAYVDRYHDAVDDYEAALSAYQEVQVEASRHGFGIAVADIDVGIPLSRAYRPAEYRMGPFVLGAEVGVVGKAGVDVLLRSHTNFAATPGDADLALGIEVTPSVEVRGYAEIYGGLDIFIVQVRAGIRGELAFAGLYMPAVVAAGLVRDEVPLDQGPIGTCIPATTLNHYIPRWPTNAGIPCPDAPHVLGLPIYGNLPTALIPPTGAVYRVPYGFNVGVQGRMLNGEISAFIRARVLGISKTWKKTLVEWPGIRRTFLSISGNGIFADSYRGEVSRTDFTLPPFGDPDAGITLWPGTQRDMVYLPDMTGAFGPPGDLAHDDPFLDTIFNLLNDNLQEPASTRWAPNQGFCEAAPVP